MSTKQIKLPKMPYGEGSMSIRSDGTIMYRKRIGTPKKEKTVYGLTPKECIQKMKDEEALLKKKIIDQDKSTLSDAMLFWLDTVKKSTLKSQSYSRLLSTIKNQIEKSNIGYIRYKNITTDEIQQLINQLNEDNYSHSTIKKTYDALNAFYRYASAKEKFDNPMLLVVMPTESNIKTETKEVIWFEQDDIDKFIEEACTTWKNGNQKYLYGYILAANIYLGLRGGELLSLQWQDIDFNNNTIYVSKTLIESRDQNGVTSFMVQKSTKRNKNRYVPINSKAKDLLLKYKNNARYTEPDDYVISTRNRKTNTLKNINDMIKNISVNGSLAITNASSHTLRHTCASLYFRKNVQIEIIAKILGHSVDVCRKTYIHLVEEQLKYAASQIDVIEI